MVSWLVWDPNPVIFTIPFIHHPVTWYGVLFAFGFLVGYFLVRRLFAYSLAQTFPEMKEREAHLKGISLTDRIAILTIIGAVVGARLGHVFFYGWHYYAEHKIDILKVWEGGLASHGGAIGCLIALLLFTFWHKKRFPNLTFLANLDAVVIAAAFAGGCIRIGNFINQEVLGVTTNLPWGVVFMHPVEGESGVALHPVQLYESLFYFAVFAFLITYWRKTGRKIGAGALSGYFFTFIFTFRFLIEFFKLPQTDIIAETSLFNMGQLLSIPCVLAGVMLLIFSHFKKKKAFG